jgi:hypothetical protein
MQMRDGKEWDQTTEKGTEWYQKMEKGTWKQRGSGIQAAPNAKQNQKSESQ